MTVDRITGLVVAGEMLAGELVQARAEVERLRAEASTWEAAADMERQALELCRAERDRLRAVLTSPPSFNDAWARKETDGYRYGGEALQNVHFGWQLAIAALRARAGEPTPADPRPLREIVHAGEPSADGVFFVDLICGHRIATRQRQGEYPCLYCGSGERRRPAP